MILQEADYYPFGMRHQNATATNHYLYNGKELNTDLGLDWYDYGFRWYDAEIGRWSFIDPLAESYQSWSGYSYVLGNPIKYIDMFGMWVDIAIGFHKKGKEKGTFEGRVARTKAQVKKIANTGQELLDILKENSSTENPIRNLYIYTHSSATGLYANSEEGFYYTMKTEHAFWHFLGYYKGAAKLNDLKSSIKKKEIVFKEDFKVYIIGCNTAKGTDKDADTANFAQELSKILGDKGTVISPDGYCASHNVGGRESGKFTSTRGTDRTSEGVQNATPGRWQTFKGGKKISTSTINKVSIPQR